MHILPGAAFVTQGGGFNFNGTRGRLLNSGILRKTGDTSFSCGVLLENRGVIEVTGGGLFIRLGTSSAPLGDFIQSDSAELRLAGGEFNVDATTFTHKNGVLGGVEEINKTSTGTNGAVLRVGAPEGSLSVGRFNFVQAAAGELRGGIGPVGAGKLELLTSGARVTLGGRLQIELAEGFAPAAGQTFTSLSGKTRTGEFTQTILPDLGAGKKLDVIYDAVGVKVRVAASP